jgi:Pyruvate/2-oxoacid:ferredoxin oxidoreductase gamma subunit
LGAYVGYTNLLPKEAIYESLKTAIKRKRFIEINEKAVDAGYDFGKSKRK